MCEDYIKRSYIKQLENMTLEEILEALKDVYYVIEVSSGFLQASAIKKARIYEEYIRANQ